MKTVFELGMFALTVALTTLSMILIIKVLIGDGEI